MGCSRVPQCVIRPMSLGDVPAPSWERHGRKAVAYPKARRIVIDPDFWQSLRNVDARAAIFFHEVGHLEGALCEPCADRQAGVWLKKLGLPTARDARRAMLGELENRDGERAAAELAAGFGFDDRAARRTVEGWEGGRAFALTVVELRPSVWVKDGECADAWDATLREASKAGAYPSRFNSSFRTYAEQEALWQKYQAGGPVAARPGFGTHQQGLSVDLSFSTDAQRERFAVIAAAHGIERDVKSERWHFTFGGARRFPLAVKVAAGAALLMVVATLALNWKA